MKRVFSLINQLEVRHISRKHRKSMWYLLTKVVMLLPLVLIGLCEIGLSRLYVLLRFGRIDRKHKTSIILSNIIAGFGGLAFPNKKTEEVARHRAEICAQCPSAVPSGIHSIVADNRTIKVQGMKCNECGCNLSAKIRSLADRCPLGKWEQ